MAISPEKRTFSVEPVNPGPRCQSSHSGYNHDSRASAPNLWADVGTHIQIQLDDIFMCQMLLIYLVLLQASPQTVFFPVTASHRGPALAWLLKSGDSGPFGYRFPSTCGLYCGLRTLSWAVNCLVCDRLSHKGFLGHTQSGSHTFIFRYYLPS